VARLVGWYQIVQTSAWALGQMIQQEQPVLLQLFDLPQQAKLRSAFIGQVNMVVGQRCSGSRQSGLSLALDGPNWNP